LAQYRELEAFSQFSSDLDDITRRQLERGKRIMTLMKQRQFDPLSVAEMSISLFAADRGYLDSIPVDQVVSFESALRDYMRREHADLMKIVNENPALTDEVEKGFKKALEDFKNTQTW
ncbi:MAG: F0F1 ATP synthase subunit alpha, partial [Gammaproteobacteria bacterium]|nr:F0F1 ATP synthase subunit alpha [Gammaproteobacteria bacterium]